MKNEPTRRRYRLLVPEPPVIARHVDIVVHAAHREALPPREIHGQDNQDARNDKNQRRFDGIQRQRLLTFSPDDAPSREMDIWFGSGHPSPPLRFPGPVVYSLARHRPHHHIAPLVRQPKNIRLGEGIANVLELVVEVLVWIDVEHHHAVLAQLILDFLVKIHGHETLIHAGVVRFGRRLQKGVHVDHIIFGIRFFQVIETVLRDDIHVPAGAHAKIFCRRPLRWPDRSFPPRQPSNSADDA